jgi:tetratricopeptide (TPR) repeat protein
MDLPSPESQFSPKAGLSPFTEKPLVRRDLWPLLLILVVTAGLFSSALPREFTNWDDPEYIVNNPLIQSLTLENLNTIVTEPYFANYAPLTLISYAVDFKLFRLEPWGYRLHNIALHLACILCLYLLLRRFNLARVTILLSVALFALHPVNVETVAWASERKNLLATLFFLLSFFHYIRYKETHGRAYYLSSLLFFLLSLLSKASTVVAPLILIAYDYRSQRRFVNVSLYDKLPFLVFAEIHTFLSIHAAGARNALNSYHHGGPLLSLFASGRLFEEYLTLLFWPVKLTALYYERLAPSYASARFWIPLLTILVLFFLLVLKSQRLLFWAVFFVVFLLPVLNIIPLPIKMANRYLYIPQIGIWVIVGILAEWVWSRIAQHRLLRATLALVLASWLAFLGAETWRFNKAWVTTEGLWSDVINKDFFNEIAHYNLGLFCIEHGQVNRAGLEFGIALGLHPRYHLALSGMGGYYVEKGKLDAAKRKFYAAIDASPDFDVAMNNLGKVFAETGQLQRALFMFHRATYTNPKNLGALNNIVVLYLRANRPDAAKEVAMGMIKTLPQAPDGYFRLGMCLEAMGDLRSALEAFQSSRNYAANDSSLTRQIDTRISSVQQKLSQHS